MINQENNDLYDLSEALKVENLTLNDYEEICKRLNRKPNRTELGMFGVMWSEHCCYRNSKPLLSNFPTKGKNILGMMPHPERMSDKILSNESGLGLFLSLMN